MFLPSATQSISGHPSNLESFLYEITSFGMPIFMDVLNFGLVTGIEIGESGGRFPRETDGCPQFSHSDASIRSTENACL